MKFHKQEIQGVYIIKPEPFDDDRGTFRRHFCEKEFAEHGITADVKQCNISENKYKHTLRGFHYQLPPHGEGKTLSCLMGSIYDVVVDVRPDSPTFSKWLAFELNSENRNSLHIPPGCANSFLTLEDNILVHYYCSKSYHPDSERGIRYNDPILKIKWPVQPQVISDKDNSWPDFAPKSLPPACPRW